MTAGSPIQFSVDDNLDANLQSVHAGPGVFAIWAESGEPYLGKTAVLQRRLRRLLRQAGAAGAGLRLGSVAQRVEYWPAGSSLEITLSFYAVARSLLPDRYLELVKLRLPPYVKLIANNRFPRTEVTTRLSRSGNQYFGPFPSRALAADFEHRMLDLFQLRRCTEDLDPSPDHPGCIYGEMGMCLRPCQTLVSESEYRSESRRVSEFLSTAGQSMRATARLSRDRLSQDMDFEGAAREHKRVEQIELLLKECDDLAVGIDQLYGVAVTPAAAPDAVMLWPVLRGSWSEPIFYSAAFSAEAQSSDRRLREVLGALLPPDLTAVEHAEHLALLARWYYSTWRQGEWIPFPAPDRTPYRRLVNAISRTLKSARAVNAPAGKTSDQP